MQELLYYHDQYSMKTEAKVLKIADNKVLLDKTIFIPASHTEPGDEGTISGIKIVGSKKLNGEIWHILIGESICKIGDSVKLNLDWQKRLLAMRLHSALHLLAGPFDKNFGKRAVAGAIKGEEANLVFKEIIDNEIIENALKMANQDITSGLEIKSYWDKERKGFRWTQVGDYPAIPDGGLHVKNTKEIDTIALKQTLNENSQTKIIF
ncbi:MAG: alanyl-tRNA editing protein, partial [bacterium]|nr:alanyl-tRNA editing protein [bacterium]